MFKSIKNILKLSAFVVILPGVVFGVQQPNPRNLVSAQNALHSVGAENNNSVRSSSTAVIARPSVLGKRQSQPVVIARPVSERGGATVRTARSVVKDVNSTRTTSKSSVARSGEKKKNGAVNVSRAGTARATAVFNDVSKIGGGYSSCRDAYVTCMDQICANANDSYRRCFCSDRFIELRDVSDRLDETLKLLAEFQNVNLDAVDKTAAEVNAMYSATEGENAIKTDASASQKLLDDISDLLSSKSKRVKNTGYTTNSLGILDFSSFSSKDDDPFGDSSSQFENAFPSAFTSSASIYKDFSSAEGADLYKNAMQQCIQVTREACGGDAMFNLARSSYSILISQDCNAYEKSLNAKKTSVEDTIRKAEKYLREARLEEYRAHNSADMNECLSAVDKAMRQPLACGANLEGCLDFTGLYISSTTGEPVYSPAFFGLNNVIILNGTSDILSANTNYLQEFEKRKKTFAESALDTCRGIADDVWEEYKRLLVIQVAQAQDDKIEQVKSSCVETIKECYNTQTGAMNSLADVSGSSVKAISALAARDMCKDKVFACAALYGDVNGCKYDDSTKKISTVEGKKCGMQSLLALVDVADTLRFEQGCEDALREYVRETCTPMSGVGTYTYPWNCRTWSPARLKNEITMRAKTYCASDFGDNSSVNEDSRYGGKLNVETDAIINKIMDDVKRDMSVILSKECLDIETENFLGWNTDDTPVDSADVINVSPAWMKRVYGNTSLQTLRNVGVLGYKLNLRGGESLNPETREVPSFGWGVCANSSVKQLCEEQIYLSGISKDMVKYDSVNDTCDFTDAWYKLKCESIGGYFENDICFVR